MHRKGEDLTVYETPKGTTGRNIRDWPKNTLTGKSTKKYAMGPIENESERMKKRTGDKGSDGKKLSKEATKQQGQ